MAGYAAWDVSMLLFTATHSRELRYVKSNVSITAEGNDIYEKYRTGQIVLAACIAAVCMFSDVHGAEVAGPPAPKSKSALTQKPEATPMPRSNTNTCIYSNTGAGN